MTIQTLESENAELIKIRTMASPLKEQNLYLTDSLKWSQSKIESLEETIQTQSSQLTQLKALTSEKEKRTTSSVHVQYDGSEKRHQEIQVSLPPDDKATLELKAANESLKRELNVHFNERL